MGESSFRHSATHSNTDRCHSGMKTYFDIEIFNGISRLMRSVKDFGN
jgi:hypothetical protein